MKILLIGASSYLGARLYFDLKKSFDVVGTYNNAQLSQAFIKLDVTAPEEIKKLIHAQQPDLIIHAASNASGKWCEEHPEEAYKLNEASTKAIVENANDLEAKVILISSFAAITHVNVYGKTKKLSEDHVKQTKAGYLILRPSLIVGFSPNTTNDRPFNRFLKNLDEKTPATYDTSWKFQASYIGHISEIIQACIEKNIWNETLPVAIQELTTRFNLAKDILGPFGIEASPIDQHDQTPTAQTDMRILQTLDLPQYTYNQMIEKIIEEIKHREEFILN